MTRTYTTTRRRRATAPIARPRNPAITPIAFTCFRLVRIDDREPGEPPFAPIELCDPTNAMAAFRQS